MNDKQFIPDCTIDGFFARSDLTSKDRADCFDFVKATFPHAIIDRSSCQGYCSVTVMVGEDLVIQFRPKCYDLDLQTAAAAREVYGRLAPETIHVATLSSGLLVYQMKRIPGVSLRDLRASANYKLESTSFLMMLCEDFATLMAQSWHRRETEPLALGLVGRSIVSRLRALSTDLPYRFQPTAKSLLKNYGRIARLPWVLNHGDLVPPNIMLDASSGRLTGLVDWAEAEKLPFGTCFYGLEELLGQMTPSGFQYRDDAQTLRNNFWQRLVEEIPILRQKHVLEAVELARDLGVLLWHGIAFDNGAINRVVREDQDIKEIYRLDAYLSSHAYSAHGMDGAKI